MEVTFTWKYGGYNVKVFGSFNNWSGEEMTKNERGVWTLTKYLPRGAYEYKFTVDGNWCYDMEQLHLTDRYGNCNNVISADFTIMVPFWWKLSGKRILVSGTFNNWTADPMEEVPMGGDIDTHHFYYKEIPLKLGFCQYKFIADDKWVYDDHQPHNYFDGTLNNYRQVNTGQSELYYFYSKITNRGLHYVGYLPHEYRSGQKCPLILYLHGSKQRGDNIQLVEEQGIPNQLKQGKSLPFIVISPQCPRQSNCKWTVIAPYLIELIEHFSKTHNVDTSKIYATGVEMGAYGVWKLATNNPNTFAAIAPFAGGGDKTKVKLITHVPVWACDNFYQETFHDTKEMVEALQSQGGTVNWIESTSEKRDCWSDSYSSDEFYNWLLQHKIPEK